MDYCRILFVGGGDESVTISVQMFACLLSLIHSMTTFPEKKEIMLTMIFPRNVGHYFDDDIPSEK